MSALRSFCLVIPDYYGYTLHVIIGVIAMNQKIIIYDKEKTEKAGSLNFSKRQLQLNIIDKLFYNTEGVKNADEGKFKEAAEYFTKAIELFPEDQLSYFNRATVKIDLGDIPGARSDFILSENCQTCKINLNKFGMN